MILVAALTGAATATLTIFALFRAGMLAERSGAAVLLAAVAIFYPVFAAAEGDVASLALHTLIFLGFAALAVRGFHKGMYLIAGGLIAHGVFDLAIQAVTFPGPAWWPAFCAGFDIVAGACLVRLIQTGSATR